MPLYEVTITSAAVVATIYRVVVTTYQIEADSWDDAISKARSGDYPSHEEQVYVEEERDVEAGVLVLKEEGGKHV